MIGGHGLITPDRTWGIPPPITLMATLVFAAGSKPLKSEPEEVQQGQGTRGRDFPTVIQWLRICLPMQGADSIPGPGRFHMQQGS